MQSYENCRNPVLPFNICIPDPEAHIMPDGRVYVYGSLDKSSETYCSREYRVISSANMVDWQDHGVSFSSKQVPWLFDEEAETYPNTDWDFQNPSPFLAGIMKEHGGGESSAAIPENFKPKADYLYAPDAIFKNGLYYLYFCCSDSSEGVAVSERPEGPFENPLRLKCGGIDPAVFIDDDGEAYYFWGQFRASGARLSPNMLALEEGSIVQRLISEEQHGFHEGSSLRKRGDTYYFVYPCVHRGRPTALAYATSKAPLGPYTYQGIIIDNRNCDPASWNIHGSIEEVNGQWYVFYHRSGQNSQYMRRLCIEAIFFDSAGNIPEVKMTSQGAGKPFALNEEIEAWRACEVEGGSYITADGRLAALDGGRAFFRYILIENPARGIAVRAQGSGIIKVLLNGKYAARLEVKKGIEALCPIEAAPGKYEICLEFHGTDELEAEALRIY